MQPADTREGDPRIDQILRFVEQVARGQVCPPLDPSGPGDALDTLMAGLNRLAADLPGSTVSRHYVESILRSMVDALVAIGPDGKIATVNRSTCELLGYGAEELVGQPVTILLAPPGGRSAEARGAHQLLTLGTTRDLALDLLARDGTVIPMLANVSVHRGPDHRVLGIVVVARDMRATQALIGKLEGRLRELRETQEALVQAGKMAAVGTLVAGLAHELNNPMTVILGYAERLLQDLPESDADGRAAAEAIERQASRCATLVETLLDFSRKSDKERRTISAAELLERVVALARPMATPRRVRVEHDPLPDGVSAVVNVAVPELESAILNLVTNALDASPPGAAVRLRLAPAVRGEARGVEIAVSDAGSGIPAEYVPFIFDPFFTTKPRGEGTGLGLSLTRHIVESHGGDIHAETAAGAGTTMRLWLPAQ